MSRTLTVQLFGALREAEPGARLELATAAATIGELREAVRVHAARWPAPAQALLSRSAFASRTSVLRDVDAVPEDGELALLPPVSGG